MYLRGLALDPFSIATGVLSLAKAANSGSGSSGGNASQGTPSISTNVQTSVSPQISPVFVQQDNPNNSPVNASPSQVLPHAFQTPGALPMTGSMPGFDYASGYGNGLYTPQSTIPVTQAGFDPRLLIFGAIVLGGIALYKNRAALQRRFNR